MQYNAAAPCMTAVRCNQQLQLCKHLTLLLEAEQAFACNNSYPAALPPSVCLPDSPRLALCNAESPRPPLPPP
jgi:hypothetical protein